MPVALSEWRARIGTFVHWIREYEVRERAEKLLRAKIRRIRILSKRLKSKQGNSEEELQDHKTRHYGHDCKGCPHKSSNKQSSENDSVIKELLTSCDQCIQELLTANDSHIQEIITTADTGITDLLSPDDSDIRCLFQSTDSCTHGAPNSQEGDIAKPRCKDTTHKGNSLSATSDSYIQKLLTSNDRYIKALLTPGDSNNIDLDALANCHIQEIVTQSDPTIEHVLAHTAVLKNDSQRYGDIKKEVTRRDFSTNEDNRPAEFYIQESLTAEPSNTNEENDSACSYIQKLLTGRDSHRNEDDGPAQCRRPVYDLLRVQVSNTKPESGSDDRYIKKLLTGRDSGRNEEDRHAECCINELITTEVSISSEEHGSADYYIQELLTRSDSNFVQVHRQTDIQKLLSEGDASRKDEVRQTKSSIQDSLRTKLSNTNEEGGSADSYSQKLLAGQDSHTIEEDGSAQYCTHDLQQVKVSNAKEESESKDWYIKKLLMGRDSSRKEGDGPVPCCTQELLTEISKVNEINGSADPYLHNLVTGKRSSRNVKDGHAECIQESFKAEVSNSNEDCSAESYIQELVSGSDSNPIQVDRSTDIQRLLSGDANRNYKVGPAELCIQESLTAEVSNTNEEDVSASIYLQNLLTGRDSRTNEEDRPEKCCVHDLRKVQDLNTKKECELEDLYIKVSSKGRDSSRNEEDRPAQCCFQESLKESLTAEALNSNEEDGSTDCFIQELLTGRDSNTNGEDRPARGCIHDLLRVHDSNTKEESELEDWYVNKLLTGGESGRNEDVPEPSCIQELLTKVLNLNDANGTADCYIEELVTGSDADIVQVDRQIDIQKFLSGGYSSRKDKVKQTIGCIREPLTAEVPNTNEEFGSADRYIQELLKGQDSSRKDEVGLTIGCILEPLIADVPNTMEEDGSTDYYIQELLKRQDSTRNEEDRPADYYIQELTTGQNFSTKDKDRPAKCCTHDLPKEHDSNTKQEGKSDDWYIEKLLTERDSSRKEGDEPVSCCIQELLKEVSNLNEENKSADCYIQELLAMWNSKTVQVDRQGDIQKILSGGDSINNNENRPAKRFVKESLKAKVSKTNEEDRSADCYVQKLLIGRDSSRNEKVLTECCTQQSLTAEVSNLNNEDCGSSDCYIRELVTGWDSNIVHVDRQPPGCIQELLAVQPSGLNEEGGSEDGYIRRLLTGRDSEIEGPAQCCIQEIFRLQDTDPDVTCYIHELLRRNDFCNNESDEKNCWIQGLISLNKPDWYIHRLVTGGDLYLNRAKSTMSSSENRSHRSQDYCIQLLPSREQITFDQLISEGSYIQGMSRPSHSVTNTTFSQRDTNRLNTEARQAPTRSDSIQRHQENPRSTEQSCKTNSFIDGFPLTSSGSPSVNHCDTFEPTADTTLDEDSYSLGDGALQHEPYESKEMIYFPSSHPSSDTTRLKEADDNMLPQQPNLAELMLVTSGDVELNPGPRHSSIDSALQDMELVLLATDVPGNYYSELSVGLGFSITEGQNALTKHLLDIPGALIELFGRWKIKQRDYTDCRAALGEILKEAGMGTLQTKLLEGRYLPSTSKMMGSSRQATMTDEQVLQCANDLRSFYLERMCKIKPDLLDFNLMVEFEKLYTNLVLLRHDKGLIRETTHVDYKDLFTTEVGGVLPKRLLVEGEGGVGKTTLCSKIARDWAEGCEEYNQFNWVLVIPLRLVDKSQTIGEIMKNYLDVNNNVSPEQIEHYIISQPSNVLIILDGFDEYDGDLSADDGSDISQVLRLDKFKQCTILVTTRPWRAHEIKCNKQFRGSYAFIAVKGFSAENVSTYINKYFVKDVDAGKELIHFIEVSDVIKENMAPFPIYVAMLCILWENINSEKRETMHRLKTFSQLFQQMMFFLKDHYESKLEATQLFNEAQFDTQFRNTEICLQQIGAVAFSGLLERKLVFKVDDFSSCMEAMTTCCRIGVISRVQNRVSRRERSWSALQDVTVFFPHKLFQEYVAALYISSLYETDREEYTRLMGKILGFYQQEFRYLLYFTVAQAYGVGIDIVERLQRKDATNEGFLVDVTFEALNKDIAKAAGKQLFAGKNVLTIDNDMSAHTVSGYLYIMEQHGVETLDLRRECGPTIAREVADVLSLPTSMTKLKLRPRKLHDNFYAVILENVSKRRNLLNNVQQLQIDDRFIDNLHKIGTEVNVIFPVLKQLSFSTVETVSLSDVVRQLAHPSVTELSIEHNKEYVEPIPVIEVPAEVGQLFSDAFPQLTSLVFQGLVMGNERAEYILQNLKKHKLKSISIIDCFTDDELDPLAKQINAENRMEILFHHDEKQKTLNFVGANYGYSMQSTKHVMDTLCHRTSVRDVKIEGIGGIFPNIHGKEVDAKIHNFELSQLHLINQQLGSHCLGQFLGLLPRLTGLTLRACSFHDDFYTKIAERVSSSQIRGLKLLELNLSDQQSGSRCLGQFVRLLPHLTDLTTEKCSFHDDFYEEITDRGASSQSPFFRDKKHLRMIETWLAQKRDRYRKQNEPSVAATHQSIVELVPLDTLIASSPPSTDSQTLIHQRVPSFGMKAVDGEHDDLSTPSTSVECSAEKETHADDSFASDRFGENGGELRVKSYGFKLMIPRGALEKDTEISLQVLTKIPDGLKLEDDEMIVSYGFKLFPSGLQFKIRAKLIIPHCAVVTIPNNIQTTLYTWNQSGTRKQIPDLTNMIWSVQKKWYEVSISHFCGGCPAIKGKRFNGISLSCMPFLPTTMPPTRKPYLEVRFVKKIRCRKWKKLHVVNNEEFQPAKDDDDVITFHKKARRLSVSCEFGEHDLKKLKSKIIPYSKFALKDKHTCYFRLDLTKENDCTPVKLEVVQDKVDLDEIEFNTRFKNKKQDNPKNSKDITDFDKVLRTVARRVCKESEIDTLGINLRFSPEEVGRYINTNHKTSSVTCDGTLEMLRNWRKDQEIHTERERLKTALKESGQTHLADELFPRDHSGNDGFRPTDVANGESSDIGNHFGQQNNTTNSIGASISSDGTRDENDSDETVETPPNKRPRTDYS